MINSETTVREVALQMPESTRLFESLKDRLLLRR